MYELIDRLQIEKEVRGDIGLVTASGEIDLSTMRPFREAARDLFRENIRHCILDLRQVQYIDSSGMSVIFTALKSTNDKKGSLMLILPEGSAAHALKIVNIDRLVRIASSVEEAIDLLAAE